MGKSCLWTHPFCSFSLWFFFFFIIFMLLGVWLQNLHQKRHPSISTITDSGSQVESLPFSSFTEHNWIRAHFFLDGQLLFLFLSSLHVISLTFPSEAYDKSNCPSSHLSTKEFFISKDWFHPLPLQSWTHQKKKKNQVFGWRFFFFFFWGSRVAWNKGIDTTHSKDRRATHSQEAKGSLKTWF